MRNPDVWKRVGAPTQARFWETLFSRLRAYAGMGQFASLWAVKLTNLHPRHEPLLSFAEGGG